VTNNTRIYNDVQANNWQCRREVRPRDCKYLVDIDFNSLYPSAIAGLPGVRLGNPKIIDESWCKPGDQLDELNTAIGATSHDCEFGEKGDWLGDIEILSVRDKWGLPMINRKQSVFRARVDKSTGKTVIDKKTRSPVMDESKGSRVFSNNLKDDKDPERPYVMRVNGVYARAMTRLAGVQWRLIRGYYWDQGYNRLIGELIRFLYRERQRYRYVEKNDPMQRLCKLIMNGIYGRTIQKAITVCKMLIGREDYSTLNRILHFILRSQDLSSHLPWSKQVDVRRPVLGQWACPAFGSAILDYSKVLMSKAKQLAYKLGTQEDPELFPQGYPIFYQDTDSLHMLEEHCDKVVEAYNLEYKDEIQRGEMRPMLSQGLGAFTSDFDMVAPHVLYTRYPEPLDPESLKLPYTLSPSQLHYYNESQGTEHKSGFALRTQDEVKTFNETVATHNDDIRSEGFICCGKKMYLHKLVDVRTRPHGPLRRGYSVTLKGVPAISFTETCYKLNQAAQQAGEPSVSEWDLMTRIFRGEMFEFDLHNSFRTQRGEKLTAKLTRNIRATYPAPSEEAAELLYRQCQGTTRAPPPLSDDGFGSDSDDTETDVSDNDDNDDNAERPSKRMRA